MKTLNLLLVWIFPLLGYSQGIEFLKDVGSLYHDLNYDTYYTGHELYVDNQKSIYITGIFGGQESIWSPNPNPEYFAKVPANNYFIQKMDINGNAIWHKLIYSGDLFNFNLGGLVGFSYTHLLNNIHIDEAENVYAGGSFKNQIEIDGVISTFDSTFSNNMYLAKFNVNGKLQYVLQGISISDEIGGSNLSDIVSYNADEVFLSVSIKDSLIINIATPDSLIEAQTTIFGSDFPSNTTTENAILKLNASTGEVIKHKVFKSTYGNSVVSSKLCMRENGNLILMGYTSKSLNYDAKITFTGSNDQKIFIAEIEPSLENPPIYVDFGKLINGQIFQIGKLEKIKDDVFLFYGFFRGDRIEIYNSSIEGNPENLSSFIGVIDFNNKKCSLSNFSNLNESTYLSKIRISTDGEYIYALGRFKEGNVIIGDTLIAISADDPNNLILTKFKLDNMEVNEIIRLPSCTQALGIHATKNSILLAADYRNTYILNDRTVETNTGLYDIWFGRLANASITNDFDFSMKGKVYPNPTSNVLYFEGITFDRLTIKDINGVSLIDIKNDIQGINISSLPPQIYFVSFYKAGKLVFHKKIVKSE